jgi:hypothetical protein
MLTDTLQSAGTRGRSSLWFRIKPIRERDGYMDRYSVFMVDLRDARGRRDRRDQLTSSLSLNPGQLAVPPVSMMLS